MLKANELRIGNYLQGDPLSIPRLQMFHNGITAITGFGISAIETGNITSLKPIPLTPEILLKCGFDCENANDDDCYYYLRLSKEKYCDLSLITGDKNGFMEVCLFPYEEVFRYKYLHQIQNAYFAITNEELKIYL